MTEHHQLPRDDQPGDYTGCWNQVHVRTVYPDTSAGVWHFAMTEALRGTYCGKFNRMWSCELPGARVSTRCVGTVTIAAQGATIGQIITTLNPWLFRGRRLEFCPDCLGMARAQAELISQPKYRLRGLLRQFDGATTPPA